MYICGGSKLCSDSMLPPSLRRYTAAVCSRSPFLYIYRSYTYNMIRINTICLFHRLWYKISPQPPTSYAKLDLVTLTDGRVESILTLFM